MDGSKKFTAFSIPRRNTQPDVKPAAPSSNPVKALLSAYAGFAEIEYDAKVSSRPPAAPAQPIGKRAVDPIRETFFKMRQLSNGISFSRNDTGLFYRQAKFMEDFTDDYPGSAPFAMYYPFYQHMGYEQLRTYFTWRTRARGGGLAPTSLSYIFLYIYELLSGIGARDPMDGLDKLMAVWTTFCGQGNALDRYLPTWLKEYHIYYPLPHSFTDFVGKHGLARHYPAMCLYADDAKADFPLWAGQSSYDITKSKFFADGNEELLADCFAAVLRGLRVLCAGHGCHLEDFFTEGIRQGKPWYPFHAALFYPWLRQPDRRVSMPGQEIYTCTNSRWTIEMNEPYWGKKEMIGYLLKKTEASLRQAVQYKYKITANPSSFHPLGVKLAQLHIPLEALDQAIEQSVKIFQRDKNRTVVTVDHEALSRIRMEALDTQDKLIVPECEEPTAMPQPAAQAELPEAAMDGWSALSAALDAVERRALRLALAGGTDMKAYALEHNIMLEVLMDSINEKAVDCIGDSLIEGEDGASGITLYEEYRDNITEMVG